MGEIFGFQLEKSGIYNNFHKTLAMQFKHVLYWSAILCAVGQLLLALYARFYGEIAARIETAELAPDYAELAMVKALNYALPISVCCLGLLLYTWKLNHVGRFALGIAIMLQTIAMDLNLRAVRHVFGNDVKLETVAWWYPDPETRSHFDGG